MNGIEQLHPKNHDLYRRVQHLVSLKWSWDAIADDAGLVGSRRVQDLCDWVLAYREPKKLPAVVTRHVAAITADTYRPTTEQVRRFEAWRKQREGARKARVDAGWGL
jgi:hypothetical protein